MNYRETPYDFTLEVLPISGGTFSALVQSQFVDVGSLFETYIAPALYNTPKVFASREPFTLVNVTCTHSNVSFGCLGVPPKEVLPLACTWYFTFAITHEEYDINYVVNYNSLRWINTRVWGSKGSRFITIGIPHVQSQELGLKYDMMTPRRVYFLIGALSKSFVRIHKYWDPNQEDYDLRYKPLNMELTHSAFYMMPIYNFISRTPYHLWVFNRHIWYSAPNLLSVKHITPHSLLYVLRYIQLTKGSLTKPVEDKILDLLEHSLLATLERADRPTEPLNPELEDFLYAALVYRDAEFPNRDVLTWLVEKDRPIREFGLTHVTNYREYIKKQLYD